MLVEDAGVDPLHDDHAPLAEVSNLVSKRCEDVAKDVGLKFYTIYEIICRLGRKKLFMVPLFVN